MRESTKTYSQWPGSVRALVTGNIIDIGCGDSPDQTLEEHTLAQIECVVIKDK